MSIKILGEVNVPKNGYRELHLYADGRVRWLMNEGALIEGAWIKDPVGEWLVEPTMMAPGEFVCSCSVCDHKFTLNGSCYTAELQYCPWCGTRMVEPKDCADCPIEWCEKCGDINGKRPDDCPVYGGSDDE